MQQITFETWPTVSAVFNAICYLFCQYLKEKYVLCCTQSIKTVKYIYFGLWAHVCHHSPAAIACLFLLSVGDCTANYDRWLFLYLSLLIMINDINGFFSGAPGGVLFLRHAQLPLPVLVQLRAKQKWS